MYFALLLFISDADGESEGESDDESGYGADYDVSKVVLADEDAADGYKCCPCEHNPAVPFD